MTKPTKEDKLKVIYEEVARKELTLGCEYEYRNTKDKDIRRGIVLGDWDFDRYFTNIEVWDRYGVDGCLTLTKIIWHPVMIGDIIKYLRDNKTCDMRDYNYDVTWLEVKFRGKHSRPIDDQPIETINFVYNLIVNYKDGSETSTPKA